MTKQAVEALNTVKADLDGLIAGLTPEEWLLDSACAGWRVRDVVAHLAAGARQILDPEPPPPGEPPMPEERERQHDVLVDRRRVRPLEEMLAEYHTFTPQLVALQAALQDEPKASADFVVPGLGTYPMHSIANGLSFDYYCHLHHDILAPGGPIERRPPERTADALRAAVEWMTLGLPQMQGPELADALEGPLVLELSDPGGGVWALSRPDPAGPVVVTEGEGPGTVVRSDPHAFIAWGTKRRDWRADCVVDGDERIAARFLDALNIV